ncbi:phospholipase D-like domain-containing protein, partial [Hutsoniella sourekii]
ITQLKLNGFDLKVIKKFGYYGNNRMHDKFCIIDLDYVMHGSYNWSKAANFNKETLATALDRKLVTNFAEEFMKLYKVGI